MAKGEPMEPGPRMPHRGDQTWQAEQRALSDRNAEAQRAGKKQREAHDRKMANMRRAAADSQIPDGGWR